MISLCMPTRYRPAGLKTMWDSARFTAANPDDLELVYRLDDDDASEYGYLEGNVTRLRGPRIVLSELWNDAHASAAGPIYWHGGDDNIFRTKDWDDIVRYEIGRYADGIVMVHGRDGFQDERVGTHSFLTRQWIEATGFFMPPYFSSDYNDLWLTEVADAIGRRNYVPDLYIEHMHPVAGKGTWDTTHQERLARHQQDDVAAKYARLLPERQAHCERLEAVIADYAKAEQERELA